MTTSVVICRKCQGVVATPFCPTCGAPAMTSDAAELVGFLTKMLRTAEKQLAAMKPERPDDQEGDDRFDDWRADRRKKLEVRVKLCRQRVDVAMRALDADPLMTATEPKKEKKR